MGYSFKLVTIVIPSSYVSNGASPLVLSIDNCALAPARAVCTKDSSQRLTFLLQEPVLPAVPWIPAPGAVDVFTKDAPENDVDIGPDTFDGLADVLETDILLVSRPDTIWSRKGGDRAVAGWLASCFRNVGVGFTSAAWKLIASMRLVVLVCGVAVPCIASCFEL